MDGCVTDATRRKCDGTTRLTKKNFSFLQVLDFKSADESYRCVRLIGWLDCARWLSLNFEIFLVWMRGWLTDESRMNRTRTGASCTNG